MNKRKIVLIIIIIFSLWLTCFITDSIRCRYNHEPVFCIEVKKYEDGGSTYYMGLFYNYYRVREVNPNVDLNGTCSNDCYLTDYVITPWFCDLEYAKSKAFH